MVYMSFFGQPQYVGSADPSGMGAAVVIGFKGFGLVLSIACLALAWTAKQR